LVTINSGGVEVSDVLWGQLIGAIPALAWVVFALIVYLTLRRPLINQLLPRISTLKGLGVELTLVGKLLDEATESSGGQPGPTVTVTERQGVLRRLDHAADFLRGGRILWVDDFPENNDILIRLFKQAGMSVDIVLSTEEAISLLTRRSYDIVLSDMARGDDLQAGMGMLQEFRRRDVRLPVLIFAAQFDPRLGVDPMIFAYTNRLDEAIHYVIDIMERVRIAEVSW
jgi:Response regulator receiver domain